MNGALLKNASQQQQKYGIVLDAGSSHTEVTLYKWLGDQKDNTGIVHEVTSCETEHGLDDREEDVNATLEELMPCVRYATSAIDFDKQGSTPVFLGATAGMRILGLKKPAVADLIFNSVQKALLGFKDEEKAFRVEQVRTLTGQEEGLFAWIAANFLKHNFAVSSAPPRQTVGESIILSVKQHPRQLSAS